MTRLLAIALALAVTAPANAAATVSGRWSVAAAASNGRAVVEVTYVETSAHGYDRNEASLAAPDNAFGPRAEKLSAPDAPVAFELEREAGTFACTGTAGHGSAAGRFVFTPSAPFGDGLAERGFGRPAPGQALVLAMDDMTLQFVDRFVRPGNPHATVDDLVGLAEHGVTPDDIAALSKRGVSIVTVGDMIALRDHGVTTTLLDALVANGAHVTAGDLIRLADHGVTPAFVAGLTKRGYHDVPADGLIALADHGVTTAFIDRMQTHGYHDVSVADLIRLRDSGF